MKILLGFVSTLVAMDLDWKLAVNKFNSRLEASIQNSTISIKVERLDFKPKLI